MKHPQGVDESKHKDGGGDHSVDDDVVRQVEAWGGRRYVVSGRNLQRRLAGFLFISPVTNRRTG